MARPALAAVARAEDPSPTLARRISTRSRPLDRISTSAVREMHRLFLRYYEHASFETFIADLKRKSGAFLVRRKADGRIVGFSTLAIHRMEVDGRPIKGLLSGDTIPRARRGLLRAAQPSWRRGTELPTVGRADLLALVKLAGLQIWKALFKPSRSGRDVQEPVGAKPEKRIAA